MRKLGWLSLFGAGWVVAACSLIVESGSEQCSSDADCTSKGPAFAGFTCSAQKVCVSGAVSQTDGGNEAGGAGADCTTNQQCIDLNAGGASVCRKDTKKCVPLLNSDCQTVTSYSGSGAKLTGADAVRDDATVLIGSLLTIAEKNTNRPKNLARVAAIELAISEIMNTAAGLPPAKGTTARRPLAVVSCNDTDDQTAPGDPAVKRSADHLFALGVPAVVGGGASGTTNTATQYLPKRGTLLIAPSATSASLTGVDDDGLLWRTAPTDNLQSIPLAARIQTLLDASTNKKVAIAYKGDAYGTGLFEVVAAAVKRGGKSLTDSTNTAFVKLVKYDVSPTRDYSALATDFAAHRPDVVSIIGTSEGVDVLTQLESTWTTANPAIARPGYVFSDGLKAAALTAAIGDDEKPTGPKVGLRARVSGTAPGRPTATTNAFYTRFEGVSGNTDARTFGTAGAYDAAYTIFYALAGAPEPVPTGKNVATGIGLLVKGATRIDVGGSGVNDAFQRLSAGTAIDLNGASSPLNYDLATGESPADIEVWCVPTNIATPTFATTSQYYDATQAKVVGDFDCP